MPVFTLLPADYWYLTNSAFSVRHQRNLESYAFKNWEPV